MVGDVYLFQLILLRRFVLASFCCLPVELLCGKLEDMSI
jgi:hypothetical protein